MVRMWAIENARCVRSYVTLHPLNCALTSPKRLLLRVYQLVITTNIEDSSLLGHDAV